VTPKQANTTDQQKHPKWDEEEDRQWDAVQQQGRASDGARERKQKANSSHDLQDANELHRSGMA